MFINFLKASWRRGFRLLKALGLSFGAHYLRSVDRFLKFLLNQRARFAFVFWGLKFFFQPLILSAELFNFLKHLEAFILALLAAFSGTLTVLELSVKGELVTKSRTYLYSFLGINFRSLRICCLEMAWMSITRPHTYTRLPYSSSSLFMSLSDSSSSVLATSLFY